MENIQDRINLFQLKDLYLNYYSNIGISSFNKMKDILIIIFCASLVIQGKQTVGELMSISYLLGQLTIPLAQLLNFALNAQDAKLSFDRLQNIQMTLEENNDRKDFLLNNLATGIQLKNIWFKYIGTYSPFVLKGISFYIPKGKVTAIVGSSGSGKTTLLKLLLNFYNPNEGEITINDTLFSEISPDAWRRKCGVIMQDGYMFSGTILDNIAISDEQVDEAKVIQSARIACIHDFIESLPLKYNTNIGNMGIELSGGQKQRILIARAIYKNPEFIFLDEATSFLDADNETRIMAYLNKFFIGKTVVIIAHRLSTVKTADNIVVLEKGVIVEQGTHNHLIMSQGRYYQLIRNQLELGN
ncbi:peptidase domain-containing ABC transporter [Bacteroides thetaiotaomicron]|uniref:peptidase domain-containing ABC transporter n=1 Tax=Bacteroides thetaiotaomicron TaxID=818 RepID=UPI0039C8711A